MEDSLSFDFMSRPLTQSTLVADREISTIIRLNNDHFNSVNELPKIVNSRQHDTTNDGTFGQLPVANIS